METKVINYEEFKAMCQLQGVPKEHYAFQCPRCGAIQSAVDLIKAGAGSNFDEVEKYIGFSCVGRWTKDRGCNWTLGGLFQIHSLEVVTPDGVHHPLFELASPDQAQSHMVENSN